MKTTSGLISALAGVLALSASGQTAQPAPKAAQPPATKKSPIYRAFKPAGVASQGKAVQIPKDAKQVDAYSWRWTDPQGKAWIYRKTPFGINRYSEADAQQRGAAAVEKNPPKVTEIGDSYKFEQPTPFGQQSWTRKKADLSDSEKEMVKDAQARARFTPDTGKAPQ